ncbi:flavin reductase family protein [Aerococcaceae bacterium WGS1372]
MYFFKASEMTKKDKKKKLSGSVIPRPVALVLTQDEGLINIAPFSYFNIVSNDPPIVSIAIQRNNGQIKDTTRNILSTKEATLHIVSEDNVGEANKTSASLAPDQSELDLTTFTLLDSTLINTPALKEAAIRYELAFNQHIEIKNHDNEIVTDLMLLEVLAFHIDEKAYDESRGYIIVDNLKAISRLAGSDYAMVGEQFVLKRPD